MSIEKERIDILTAAAEAREREIMHYQINIDNYQRAIAEIHENHRDDKEMQSFAEHLRSLLASSKVEQTKERILAKIIRDQLEEAKCTSV